MSENCCSTKDDERQVSVRVNVDVPKIVKYSCLTGVLIVAIICGSKTFQRMLDSGFFKRRAY
jgi:hypothetical protein